jgi:hypothetical protein
MSVDESAAKGGGCLRAIGVVICLVVVLAVVAVGIFSHEIQQRANPPDVAKVARSVAVASTDDWAVMLLDRGVAEVVSAAPALTVGARGVDDTCGSEPGAFFGQRWSPVSCTRTVTQVLSCDCDIRAAMVALDRALTALGWHGNNLEPPQSAGVANYADVNRVTVQITWGGSADRGRFHGPWRPAEGRPAPGAGTPLDIETAVTGALRRHRTVALVSAELRYYGA